MLAMLKDLIKTTSDITPIVMSVSLKDVLFLHEILNRVVADYTAKDKYDKLTNVRLYACFDIVKSLSTSIKDYQKEEREASWNLTLPRELLTEPADIVKCKKCNALVTAELISEEKVKEAYMGRDWECPQCEGTYSDLELRCSRCKRCRSDDLFDGWLPLERYKPIHTEPVLGFLEELLVVGLHLIPKDSSGFFHILEVPAFFNTV